MAFFPRNLYGSSDASFTSLVRVLNDLDQYSRQGTGHHHRRHIPTFQPKFDVREVADAYELHGELAGLNKSDVTIEFTDPHTLQIRGHVDRSYTAGTPPAALVADTEMSGALTEEPEEAESTTSKNTHQASVEDEDAETTASTTAEATPATTVAEVAQETEKKNADSAKYWVSERSIGQFSRAFHFPGQILEEEVTASFKDGILNIRVPKAPKHEIRRVDIN